MRLIREQLIKKMKENGCDNTLSWSKLNTFVDDPFSFYLKYIKGIKEEKKNAYAFLGDIVHNGLEKFYNNEFTKQQMIEAFEEGLATQHNCGIKFVKDDKQNDSIESKYYTCILNFLYNYEKKSNQSRLEQFVGMPFGHYYMQGYIDHIYPYIEKNPDQNNPENIITKHYVVIEDFKTSTAYSGKMIDEKAGQLKLYAIMFSNNYNVPIENIKIGWNFLKYVKVDYLQKNGKIKTSNIERHELDVKLQAKVKTVAKSLGYSDEDIQNFYEIMSKNLKQHKNNNIFDGMPPEFNNYFTIRDCFVEIPFDKEKAKEFIDYVLEQIELMDSKIEAYNLTQDENLFWLDVTKENSFFFINLCGYTAKNHKPLAKYLEGLQSFDRPVQENDSEFDDFMNSLFDGMD